MGRLPNPDLGATCCPGEGRYARFFVAWLSGVNSSRRRRGATGLSLGLRPQPGGIAACRAGMAHPPQRSFHSHPHMIELLPVQQLLHALKQ